MMETEEHLTPRPTVEVEHSGSLITGGAALGKEELAVDGQPVRTGEHHLLGLDEGSRRKIVG